MRESTTTEAIGLRLSVIRCRTALKSSRQFEPSNDRRLGVGTREPIESLLSTLGDAERVCEDLRIFFNAMGFKGEVPPPPMERQDG